MAVVVVILVDMVKEVRQCIDSGKFAAIYHSVPHGGIVFLA